MGPVNFVLFSTLFDSVGQGWRSGRWRPLKFVDKSRRSDGQSPSTLNIYRIAIEAAS